MSQFMALTRIPILVLYGDNIPAQAVDLPAQDSWRARLTMARNWRDTVTKHGGNVTLVPGPARPALIGVSSMAITRERRTESSWALKIGSTSDTAAGISVVIQARLTLMPASCSLTCWRYRIEDIHGMADFITRFAGVDGKRLGLLGLCGGGARLRHRAYWTVAVPTSASLPA
jgi:hypothetical protein